MRDNKIKLLVVILISILLVTLAINNYGIWTDEAYTLYMINNPISQILQKENSLDGTVLYMLLLKLFVEIFNGNNIKTTIFLSRLFSIIPYICLIIFGSIYIENIYSKNHGFMFIISIFTSNLISYSFEIRSYSWTILFSTLAFVSFLAINKRNNSKDWILFSLFSTLSFWFHKISTFPLFILYFFLFIQSIKNKNYQKFIKYSLLTFIMCLPIVLFSVISNLGKPNYLYASGAIGQIFSYSKLIESIVFPFDTGNLYLSLIFLLLVGYIFISWLIVNKNNLIFSLIVGFFVLPITVIILMSFAYASNHDYYPKYMLPSLGILFTTISIILVDLKYNKIFIFLIILINLFSYSNIFIIENKSKHEFKKLEEFTNDFINNNETIIFNFDYGMYIVDYYQFEGFKSNEFIWDTNYIEKENSLYFIQTDKLNDYFIDGTDEIVDYHIIESFEIRFDKFSLCKVNIQ